MHKFQRITVTLCATVIAVQSLCLWQATGRRWFTQFYRADLDPANIQTTDLDRTLDAAGLYDSGGRPEQVDFQFRLGLVPSGFGKQLLSVLTLAGPALLVGGIALWPRKPTVTPR